MTMLTTPRITWKQRCESKHLVTSWRAFRDLIFRQEIWTFHTWEKGFFRNFFFFLKAHAMWFRSRPPNRGLHNSVATERRTFVGQEGVCVFYGETLVIVCGKVPTSFLPVITIKTRLPFFLSAVGDLQRERRTSKGDSGNHWSGNRFMICLSYKPGIAFAFVSLGDHSLVNIRARQVSPRACDKNRFIVTANPECCIKVSSSNKLIHITIVVQIFATSLLAN